MMIIKPGKYATTMTVSVFLFVVLAIVFVAMLDRQWQYLIILGMFIPAYIPIAIASCRTLIMDKDGCTVKFLWYKKQYCWDELKLKQYVEYTGYFRSVVWSSFPRAAEFCPKDVSIPKTWDAHMYSQRRHPFTFFFVTFNTNDTQKNKSPHTGVYETDEKMFREKLKEWGVEMEETTRGGEG